jgi:hypothetical protein
LIHLLTQVVLTKTMKREDSLLNLICFIAAAGFFALIAYDILAGGSIISTDGLFFIVVPLVFALVSRSARDGCAAARDREKKGLGCRQPAIGGRGWRRSGGIARAKGAGFKGCQRTIDAA